jgi:hypothetical protein
MPFTCQRCGYETPTRCNIIRHLKSKTPCEVMNKNIERDYLITQLTEREFKTERTECPLCKKSVSKYKLSRHTSVCKSNTLHTMVHVPLETLENLQAQINELRGELQKQKDSSTASASTSTVNTNSHNNTTINNTYNIQLNNFGQENMACLTPELLTYCLTNPKKGMSSLIEKIHYNKDYPENHNLRCKSLKNNIFERFVDAQWTLCDASNTLDELIKKGYRILEAHFAEIFLSDPEFYDDEHRVESMQRFRQVLNDKTSNDYHSVKRDLRLLVKDKTMYLLEMVEPVELPNDTNITDALDKCIV